MDQALEQKVVLSTSFTKYPFAHVTGFDAELARTNVGKINRAMSRNVTNANPGRLVIQIAVSHISLALIF